MFVVRGVPVETGIAVGEALLFQETTDTIVPPQYVNRDQTEREKKRVEQALEAAAAELEREIAEIRERSELGGRILEFHRALLLSPDLRRRILENVERLRMAAPYAVVCATRVWYEQIARLRHSPIAGRRHDILDVERRLLRHVGASGPFSFEDLDHEVVVVAHALTPSQTAALASSKVLGFATDVGGKTSHTAIMARALSIPAVVGTGDLSRRIRGGETVIIDGIRGEVIVEPDEETLNRFRAEERRHRTAFSALVAERALPAETIDGYEVEISANIELAEEVEVVERMGGAGVGLYRTEFLYEENPAPSEDVQVHVYRQVLKALKGKPCVIRTMDLGADKLSPNGTGEAERNPFLGSRSIRYSLQHPDQFETQLRAIFRASVDGDVRLLFPMISTVEELRAAKEHVRRVQEQLKAEGVRFRERIPIGIMVEVPSTALTIDRFAPEVDFLSIGTNDLIQYTLAVDRVNQRVAHLYQPSSPAILRLLHAVIETAHRFRVPVSACGEMAADPRFTVLLLGFGLRRFSVAPVAIPMVKHVVRSVTMAQAESIAERALTFATAAECDDFLQERICALLPAI